MRPQRGAALLLALLVAMLGALALLLPTLGRPADLQEAATAEALGLAKAALIGHAASVKLTLASAVRPGDLPCPDLNDDGNSELSCGDGPGTSGQSLRLGRLPWKTLGLPDLRDGSGERLWYAVSSNFKNNTRYAGPVNSDTPGTITLRDAAGHVIFDAAAGNGVVAVIIAPGAALLRLPATAGGAPYRQSRGASLPPQPIDYLDTAQGEDNASFVDRSASDGFISGPARDGAGNILVNDRLAWITTDELAPHLERRVAAEVANCLKEYGNANGARYPWPAAGSLGTPGAVSYADTANRRFGRVPDTLFAATRASAADMGNQWTAGSCNISSTSGWWMHWKEQVFYAVAENHRPAPGAPANRCGVSGFAGASCLTADGTADRQFLVLVSGRRLAALAQQRGTNSQRNDPANYLEGENASDDGIFSIPPRGSAGNDLLRGTP